MKKKAQKKRNEKYRIALGIGLLVIVSGIIILNHIVTGKITILPECSSIHTEAEEEACIKKQAVISLDADLCSYSSNSAASQHCVEIVQAFEHLIKTGHYQAVFEKLSIKPLPLTELYEYDMVFAEFAAATGNFIFCQEPASQQDRDRCYKRFAYTHKDIEACTAISDVIDRDSCFIQLAMAGKEIECEFIEDSKLRQSCFSLEKNGHSTPTTRINI